MTRASGGKGTFAEAIERQTRAQVERERTPAERRSEETISNAVGWVRENCPDLVADSHESLAVGAALTLRYLHLAGGVPMTPGGVRERVRRRLEDA